MLRGLRKRMECLAGDEMLRFTMVDDWQGGCHWLLRLFFVSSDP